MQASECDCDKESPLTGICDKWDVLMQAEYKRWQEHDRKEDLLASGGRPWSYEQFIESIQKPFHKDVILLGNFNYQVCNGGFMQWIDNGYSAHHERLTDIFDDIAKFADEQHPKNCVIGELTSIFEEVTGILNDDGEIDYPEFRNTNCEDFWKSVLEEGAAEELKKLTERFNKIHEQLEKDFAWYIDAHLSKYKDLAERIYGARSNYPGADGRQISEIENIIEEWMAEQKEPKKLP